MTNLYRSLTKGATRQTSRTITKPYPTSAKRGDMRQTRRALIKHTGTKRGDMRHWREATFGKQGQQSAKQASKTGTQQSQTTTARVNNTQAAIQKHQRNSQQTQSRSEPLVNTSPCVRKHETAQSRKHESRKSTNMACSFSQSISLLCIAE